VGEPGYGFLIQTETRVDVIATAFAFNISIFCFKFMHVSLQLIIDYFSYHNLLQDDMI
jgi:hypothetical protein